MSESGVLGVGMPPSRRKKYHRRGPWACDECRLRKRKCDGLRPCSPCISISHTCTYESRSLIQPPTQRIRALEDKLRHARAILQQLKSEDGKTSGFNLDSAVQALDFKDLPAQDEGPSVDDSAAKDGKLNNMMGGCGQLVSRPRSSQAFFGASSGFSFVCRTLELFLKDSEATPSIMNIQSAMLDLFDGPVPETFRLRTYQANLQDLPAMATTLQLLTSLFTRCSLIAQLLQQAQLRRMVSRIYEPSPLDDEAYTERALVLLHSLLALVYHYHVPLHQTQGCPAALDEALQHFSTARRALDITQCNDLLSLQTLLCIAIFLISTSRIVAAHPYIGVACSSALRLGLHSRSLQSASLTNEQRQTRMRTLTTILRLDVYVSLVLGLSPFLDLHNLHRDLTVGGSNMPSGGLFSGSTNHEDSMRLELSLKHLELLKITASGLDAIFPQLTASKDATDGDSVFTVNIQHLEEVESQFQGWVKSFSSFLPRMGDSPVYEIVEYELEMTYYFGQIVLYQPFLHYLKRMANKETLSRSQSRHALACIKISSITITRSEEMMKRGLLCSASWMSVYTVFLSVVSLVFLIAAHNGTSKPSEAWRRAQSGIRLLAAARCRDDGATACLAVLKVLSSELSHTVNFDFDQIESSTARLCQYSLTHSERTDHSGSVLWRDRTRAPPTGDLGSSFTWKDRSTVLVPSPLRPEESMTMVEGDSGEMRPGVFRCDADAILAQAEEIPWGPRIDDFLNLDDFVS